MPEDQQDQPTLARRQLGAELRKLREAANLTIAHVAAETQMHRNSIVNIEKGKTGTKPLVVKALCELYGAPSDVMSHLTGLVVKGKQRGLWESNQPGLEPKLRWFASAEQEYGLIQTWEPLYIPGLLQVPEYHQVLHLQEQMVDDKSASNVWTFRTERQKRYLGRVLLPTTQMLIGDTAIRYLDKYPDVKDAQLKRMEECSRMPGFDIRIVTELHPAMTGGFTILSPDADAPTELAFVYIDALDGCRYVEDAAVVERYVRCFMAVRKMAISLKEYLR